MDATAELFVGTWSFSAPETVPCHGLIHFSREGQIIQALTEADRPSQRHWFDLKYEIETSATLRIRPSSDHQGWTRDYRFDDRGWTMSSEGASWFMRRVADYEVPQWFRDAVDGALKG